MGKNHYLCVILALAIAAPAWGQYCVNGQCYRIVEQPTYRISESGQIQVPWTDSRGRTGWYASRVSNCRNPECEMCETIETRLGDANRYLAQKAADQANLTDDQITDVLRLLSLTPEDVLADVGCGDGRLLIAAARRYGCQAVGIEIDKTLAQKAYDRVKELEREGILEDGQVQVFHGDAAKWDLTSHGITKGVAYLFPETLTELSGTLAKIPLLITPFHEIPGREVDDKVRDFYVYRQPAKHEFVAAIAPPVDPWRFMTYE